MTDDKLYYFPGGIRTSRYFKNRNNIAFINIRDKQMGGMNVMIKHFHQLSFQHHADKVSGENGEHKVIAGSLGSVKNSSAQPPKLPLRSIAAGAGAEMTKQPIISVKMVISGSLDARATLSRPTRSLPSTPGVNARVSTQSRPLPPTPGGNSRVSTQSRPLPPTPGGNGRVSTQSRPLPPTPGTIAKEKSTVFVKGQIPSDSTTGASNRVRLGILRQVNTISAEKGINATTGSVVKNESFVDVLLKNVDGFLKGGEITVLSRNTNAILPMANQQCVEMPNEKSEFYKAQTSFGVYRGELTPFVMYSPRFLSSINENISDNRKICSGIIEHKKDLVNAMNEIS